MKQYIRASQERWEVYGEYGGRFARLEDARVCAKEASMTPEYDYSASIWNIKDALCYITYEHGKCVRDGWTLPTLKRTGEKAKFKFDGKIVEKTIYLKDGKRVVKHNGKIYTVNS